MKRADKTDRGAKRATRGRAPLPFVVVNMAMTVDGKIASADRKVSSFGSARDRRHLLELRATADAVMAGARTVDLNKINMGPGPARYRRLRQQRGLAEYNLRVIVSRNGTVNPNAEVFRRRFSPIIILTTQKAGAQRLKMLSTVADEVRVCGGDEIKFKNALRWLRLKWKVKRLLCEGGGELNDALFRANLVDELHLTVCPFIFGGRDAPTIADGEGVTKLSRARKLQCKSARKIGNEMFFVFVRAL